MSMLKWPASKSEPRGFFLAVLIFGLKDVLAFYRVAALHAVWAYRHNIPCISDSGLANQILSALLDGLRNAGETVTDLDNKEEAEGPIILAHLESVMTYYHGLIQILQSLRRTSCTQLDLEHFDAIPKIATFIKDSKMNFSSRLIIQLLEVITLINEGLHEETSAEISAGNPTDASCTQIQRVWQFMTGWSHDALTSDDGEAFLHGALQGMNPNFFFYVSKLAQWTQEALKEDGRILGILPDLNSILTSVKSFLEADPKERLILSKRQLRKAREAHGLLEELKNGWSIEGWK
ncbi:hypothetical protein M422DRAFT_242298 [Sphaerobolus stellatus SS14]|nr:hypothetical protein M422DRAFT_242298 [Sphaerobolus stellatus SS14]